MQRRLRLIGVFAVAGLFIGLPDRLQASTILITSAAGIANDGLLDWGALGPSGTVVSNPFTTPIPGLGFDVTVSQNTSNFQRLDQGTGEELLWTGGQNGPMEFLFDAAIDGFGTQIQVVYSGPFTATISAYDAANNSLGTWSELGDSTSFPNDDLAIFIGILSDTLDIRRVELSVLPTAGLQPENFAVNNPRIQGTTAVPEPVSMLLIGAGLLGVGIRRRALVRHPVPPK